MHNNLNTLLGCNMVVVWKPRLQEYVQNIKFFQPNWMSDLYGCVPLGMLRCLGMEA